MTKVLRRIVGYFVVMISWLTKPAKIERDKDVQKSLDKEAQSLRVYDYKGCPASMRVRQTIHRLNVDIQLCDIRTCQVHRDNLLSQFGNLQAPCLRIEEGQNVQWLDEPTEIIHYLNQRFDNLEQERAHA